MVLLLLSDFFDLTWLIVVSQNFLGKLETHELVPIKQKTTKNSIKKNNNTDKHTHT